MEERTQMKKLAGVIVAGLVVATAAFSQTTVGSAIMGYTKITIPSNQFVLVSLDFSNESNTISELFGSLPVASMVYIWDATTQSYNTIVKSRSGWGTPGTNKISIGSGVFVALPTDVQTTNLLFSGIVPTAGTTDVYKVSGYSLVSFPYPTEVSFTNTMLAKNAISGEIASFWSNGWVSYSKGRSGWLGAENVKIRIGDAFFYHSSTNEGVGEIRPYNIE